MNPDELENLPPKEIERRRLGEKIDEGVREAVEKFPPIILPKPDDGMSAPPQHKNAVTPPCWQLILKLQAVRVLQPENKDEVMRGVAAALTESGDAPGIGGSFGVAIGRELRRLIEKEMNR